MSPIVISWIVFACIFGGALFGIFLRHLVPDHHLNAESKEVVRLGMGLIATMAALVLALLIASAKSSHDTQNTEVIQMAANIILLDRVLAHYGPEAKEARNLLRSTVAGALDQIWTEGNHRTVMIDTRATKAGADDFYQHIEELAPRNDFQRSLQGQALQVSADIAHTRALLVSQSGGSVPMPFLVVLVFWLAVILMSFGLFAPVNSTVIGVLFVCALSLSASIFLIMELDRPFEGLIQISSDPLRNALAHLGS